MIFLLVLCIAARGANTDIQTFVVDLDQPPENRWKQVLVAKQAEIIKMQTYVEGEINPIIRKNLVALILKGKIFSDETLREFRGAAEILKSDVNTMILGNFMNEFYSMCSSILVRKSDGSVILGRNLDYFLQDYLRGLVVDIEFHRGGEVLYKAVTFAGYFGVLTGMKPGSFAMSLNQRDLFDMHWLWETTAVLSGGQATAFAMRHALETFTDYQEALNYLEGVDIISGEYICLAGLGEGAIITRNRKYVADLLELDEERWFIVQTNYDHWLPQPGNDDRYHPAIERIEEAGQENLNEENLFKIMSLEPTNNKKTVYSAIMNPGTGYWFATEWVNK